MLLATSRAARRLALGPSFCRMLLRAMVEPHISFRLQGLRARYAAIDCACHLRTSGVWNEREAKISRGRTPFPHLMPSTWASSHHKEDSLPAISAKGVGRHQDINRRYLEKYLSSKKSPEEGSAKKHWRSFSSWLVRMG